MELTFTQFAAAAILASASTGAMASPVAWNGSFALYDSSDGPIGGSSNVSGYIDTVAGTWSVASDDTFLDVLWTASGGTLYGPGIHTINVNGDGLDAYSGDGNVTFTVGAGQLGGNINVAWNGNNGIDVFQVWDVVAIPGVAIDYVSIDADGDGLLGMKLNEAPFVGVNVVFNMAAPVPEASTYAMLLAGLGLVGGMAARRRTQTG